MATTTSRSAIVSAAPVASSPLEAIRNSLTSIESCTSSTHSLLNTIFFPSSSKSNNKVAAPRTGTTRKKLTSTASEVEKGFTTIERYRLATEVVNSTLKVLNSASKQVQPPGETIVKDVVQPELKLKKAAKAGTQPLKSRSSNRETPPSATLQHPATWIAECSCLAISFIYSIHHSSELPTPPPPLQIEAAQHNLIVRLIILKMYDVAVRELVGLKKRLEGVIEGGKAGIESRIPARVENKKPMTAPAAAKCIRGKNTDAKEESIASLLVFNNIPPITTIRELVVGFQMSVMRCIIGMGKQGSLEALVTSLSAPNNTLALLRTVSNPASKLAALDSLLFSCCPSISSSADGIAKASSPKTVLQLQAYALEAKALCKTKKPEEYWELLIKCLAAFCRRCTPQNGGKERYKVVREVILRFQNTLTGHLPENILQMLSTVAQESGYGTEALKWMEQANAILGHNANVGEKELSEAANAGRLVKLAALSLKAYSLTLTPEASTSLKITVDNVADIVEKVKNSLLSVDTLTKVKAEDLERLLQEVALFRRAATLVAIAPLPPVTLESKDLQSARKDLQELCTGVSEMAVRYYRNYISLQPHNWGKIKRLAGPAVDFISAKIRQEAGNGSHVFLENWEALDKSLNNCLDLMKFLVEQENEHKMDTDGYEAGEDGQEKETEFEKISSAYWKAACALKKLDAQRERLKAMKRSVTALLGRPKEETLRGGLAAKLERLGNSFYQVGEIARAEEAFSEGINVLMGEGAFDEILHFADNSCLIDIFGEDRIGMMVGRMLDGIVKCAFKDAPKRWEKNPAWDRVPFDSEFLNRETRGLVLEWELRALIGLGTEDLAMTKAVAERLLELYTDEEPLRRARVISKILKLQVDNNVFMDSATVLGLGEEVETLAPLHRDAALKPRRNDIVSSCLISYAFLNYQASEPRPDILQTALISWRNTIENCNDWDRLLERVEDPEELIAQLYMLVEFFEVKGLSFHRITALRSLILIRGIEITIHYDALVKLHSLLGIQYLRMGYSGKAGMVLAKANSWIDKEGVLKETMVQWHVAYTEYLIGIGNLDKAKEHYNAATMLVNGDTSIFECRKIGSKLERRVMLNRVIADASYVMSLLCFELGNPNDSLCHVRRCIRLNQRSWAVLEQLCRDSRVNTTKDSYPQLLPNIVNPNLQKLIDGVDRLSVSQTTPIHLPIQSMTFTALNAPLLWTLVTSMYLSLIQASLIYRHQGMVREAMFNMEQALKTVEAVGATPLIAQALSIFGDLKIRAGALSEGADMLEKATDLRAEIERSKEIVSLDCSVGFLHGKNRLWEEEWGAYDHAESKLVALMSPRFIKNIDELTLALETDDDVIVMDVDEESVSQKQPSKRPRTPTNNKAPTYSRGKSAASKPAGALKEVAKAEKGIITECSSLLKLRGNILRLKAYNLAMQSQVEKADSLLQEAGKLPSGQHEIIYQRLAAAKHLLLEGLNLLASDPVFCVLQDSTISLPSVAPSKNVTTQDPTDGKPVKDLKKARKGKAMKEPEVEKTASFRFVEILTKARDSVADIHYHAAKVGSTTMVHSVSMLLGGIIVLLSAISPGSGKGTCHPLLASYSLELDKGLPLLREKDAVEAEKATAGGESLSWPQITPFQDDTFKSVSTPFTFSSFQTDYIDIIPPRWAAVSISLSEAEDELYISRFQAGQGQFILRLPLTRHNIRDDAEEIFEYGTGIETLKEILEKANTSTHAAKEATAGDKASKTEWWAERESLDAQLGELLSNIEHCWLGGFKGIFGQYPRHPELLGRFRVTFEKILAQNLPSRQPRRGGKKGMAVESLEPVKVDPRVLDLFVGLGDPTKTTTGDKGEEEQEDLDASLVDLLWFVFDILQFHGERNAYDEIDIDEIVVAVKEALRAYYQQISYLPKSEQETTQHTILILDKNVHQVPWESLPCLSGHAVSRLPSLASLRSILVTRKMDIDQDNPGVYVDENKGTWVLNPSGDLTSTQSTFEKDLQTLPGNWTGISSRAPSEVEFSNALAESEIMLYFGHGSGGQYIRARAVKKLDECAVALLMGCSSGALKEAGEFEPYGMPLAYLLGGSAAVVANLWDVTDKDIDRFSKKVLEDWGLLRGVGASTTVKGKAAVPATPARNRSKSRERKMPMGGGLDDGGLFGVVSSSQGVGKGKISLVEAVAAGRKECHLKYLNGAAPVVYGVPVYLA